MRPLRLVMGPTVVLLLITPALAEHFTGTYAAQGTSDATLSLREDANGHITGTLRSGPRQWELDGRHQEGEVAGTATDGKVGAFFEAELEANTLHLTLTELDARGKPDHSRDRLFLLSRTSRMVPSPPKPRDGVRKGRE
jgi:hypothetical protein